MGTKTYNNYEDLLTFTRASGGHALRPVSYGSELVTNGTFDTDTSGWTGYGDSSLSVVSGELNVTNNSTGYGYAAQAVTTEVGKVYKFAFDFNHLGTTGHYRLGTALGTDDITSSNLSSDQSVEHFFVATTTTVYIRVGNQANTAGHDVQYDNISVKEVTFDESDGTLTLFEHPNNIPRVEYDADGNRLGLLVEEARTNLVTYSEDFSDSSWETVGTKVPNSATSPTGENNASLLSVDYLEIRPSVVSGTQYTYSIFVKGLTDFTPQIIVTGTSFPNTQANFDLSDGTVTSTTAEDATIKDCGNGWFRISITETATATDSTSRLRLFCEQAYIWGAQLEEGSFPTSYIKTTGSTATRSADIASIPLADFGFNADEGSWLMQFQAKAISGTVGNPMTVLAASDNTTSNRIRFTITGFEIAKGGVSQASLSSSFSANVEYKWAGVYKENDFAFSQNGGAASTDTAGNIPTVTQVEFGGYLTNRDMTGHIKSIKYYPRRLTNAQLQDLTS